MSWPRTLSGGRCTQKQLNTGQHRYGADADGLYYMDVNYFAYLLLLGHIAVVRCGLG